MNNDDKYDHEVPHHDPQEGFDHSEPAARKITMFVIVSVITLVVTILALQSYFEKIWNEAVYEKVLSVPGEEVGDLRSLSNWRLSHYEYADPSKTRRADSVSSAPRSCSWPSRPRARRSIPASPPSRSRKSRPHRLRRQRAAPAGSPKQENSRRQQRSK